MAGGPSKQLIAELASRPGRNNWADKFARWAFISISVVFLSMLLIAPLVTVLTGALSKGLAAYTGSFMDDV